MPNKKKEYFEKLRKEWTRFVTLFHEDEASAVRRADYLRNCGEYTNVKVMQAKGGENNGRWFTHAERVDL